MYKFYRYDIYFTEESTTLLSLILITAKAIEHNWPQHILSYLKQLHNYYLYKIVTKKTNIRNDMAAAIRDRC